MDPKKQMNPELQQIYDRVMSTSAKPSTPATPPPAAAPTPPAPAAQAMPSQSPTVTPITSTPGQVTPPQAHQEPLQAGGQPTPVATPAPAPQTPAGSSNFVFNGNKVVTSEGTKPASTGKKIPSAVIIGGIVVFIIVWAVGWALVFGLISF